jgi:hypothetical protein
MKWHKGDCGGTLELQDTQPRPLGGIAKFYKCNSCGAVYTEKIDANSHHVRSDSTFPDLQTRNSK